MQTAGALRRLMATYLDMLVFCGLSALLVLPVSQSINWTALPGNLDEIVDTVTDPSWLSHASGVLGMWIALWWCYFVSGWGLFGATPGKWAVGLRVVDHRGRYPIGFSRSLLRLVAYMVSSLTFGLGHLLIVTRSDRRALHDMLAGTRVVHKNRRPRTIEESTQKDTDEEGATQTPPPTRKADADDRE
jgi:uncharacterized RDD family membrane protein YckC